MAKKSRSRNNEKRRKRSCFRKRARGRDYIDYRLSPGTTRLSLKGRTWPSPLSFAGDEGRMPCSMTAKDALRKKIGLDDCDGERTKARRIL